MKSAVLSTATALFVAAISGFSQTAPTPLTFEVASVKEAPPLVPELVHSGKMHLGVKINAAQADFGGVSLTDLIARAYRVRTFQINGPGWMSGARFDILGKLPDGASPGQVPEMLQALLAERFGLKLRVETKELPVYALVMVKGGSKLTPRPADYDPAVKNVTRPISMDAYAELLTYTTDRPVVDLTEMKGEFMLANDVVMRPMIARMRAMASQTAAAAPAPSPAPSPAPLMMGGPSETVVDPASATFNDVQALGLKLEPRKLPLPYLVIEHLEKTPSGN